MNLYKNLRLILLLGSLLSGFFVTMAQESEFQKGNLIYENSMAKKQDVDPAVIWRWMEDHPNSYEIKLEIEWKEEVDNEKN